MIIGHIESIALNQQSIESIDIDLYLLQFYFIQMKYYLVQVK